MSIEFYRRKVKIMLKGAKAPLDAYQYSFAEGNVYHSSYHRTDQFKKLKMNWNNVLWELELEEPKKVYSNREDL